MNTPEYKKAYMANLALSSSNNNKNLIANKRNPSLNQYIQNSGNQVLEGMTMRGMSIGGMSMGGGTPKKASKKNSK